MRTVEIPEDTAEAKVFKNILYLTDFSEPSESALPFAASIARRHGSNVFALHVLTPEPYLYTTYLTPASAGIVREAEEERAKAEMQKTESQLSGVRHEVAMRWGPDVWAAAEQAIRQQKSDLIVLGTHGRTGAEKFLMGSVAEEIFRRSPVPVLTIGPRVRAAHNGAIFHRVLFATDFTPESVAARPYAMSFAQENQAHLLLLFVMRRPKEQGGPARDEFELSVAEAIHRLYDVVPEGTKLTYAPEVAVEYGDPADRILSAAAKFGADLIVMGVRDAGGRMSAATHLERTTAHKVVTRATCPVLTARG